MEIPIIENIIKKIDIPFSISKDKDKLFIFGRNPTLSLAELISMFKSTTNRFEIIEISPSGVILRPENEWVPSVEQGGMILKRCSPVSSIKKPASNSEINDLCVKFVDSLFIDNKCHWSLSSYNERNQDDAQIYDNFYKAIRENLKKNGIKKAMYVKPEYTFDKVTSYKQNTKKHHKTNLKILMPRALHRKHILDNGFELVLYHTKDEIIVCQTDQAINIDDLKNRDVKRPFVRPMLGIGVALARSMVNLAMQPRGSTIYDPFCGTGTIVQEAHLSGYNAMGSDIDSQCVQGAFENLQWITKTYEKQEFPTENIFSLDLTNAMDKYKKGYFAAIVTEPYLGPPLKFYPNVSDAQKMKNDLTKRFNVYFRNISYLLHKNGMCVIIVPRIRSNEGEYFSLDVEKLFSKHGFEVYNEHFNDALLPYVFIHAPKDQKIEREIYVLKKRKEIS
jgi:tRNA G10  N-methylase Trm11